MNAKTQGIMAISAGLLVLFTNMLDPRISLALSFVALVGYGVYCLVKK
jgi:hypothetical protein